MLMQFDPILDPIHDGKWKPHITQTIRTLHLIQSPTPYTTGQVETPFTISHKQDAHSPLPPKKSKHVRLRTCP